ncbi:hypothetical protein scyTo_0016674, partial [Scyliorhinus torazame]|nr:hypothetical protein [Scyliorhinus torazame]
VYLDCSWHDVLQYIEAAILKLSLSPSLPSLMD